MVGEGALILVEDHVDEHTVLAARRLDEVALAAELVEELPLAGGADLDLDGHKLRVVLLNVGKDLAISTFTSSTTVRLRFSPKRAFLAPASLSVPMVISHGFLKPATMMPRASMASAQCSSGICILRKTAWTRR